MFAYIVIIGKLRSITKQVDGRLNDEAGKIEKLHEFVTKVLSGDKQKAIDAAKKAIKKEKRYETVYLIQ